MKQLFNISNSQLFVAYAKENPKAWKLLRGKEINHKIYGIGHIKSVDDGYFYIDFLKNDIRNKQFQKESLANEKIFADMELPTNLEGIEKTKKSLETQHLKQLEIEHFIKLKKK
ncbi:hypothetical protein Cyast_1439 [Cyanobacterium stanieri PCC 7202]|uniref:Uncharacterized protein n=1 Tax=Cyanobacterium stanieri (strain ATCC 29140 / PCC 7202) TaxID=292563 RepID=K9YMQ8_CYASC|nr:hypothetical protein Cyast_1439 [Cyanobacterium stanieri PCC 7202]